MHEYNKKVLGKLNQNDGCVSTPITNSVSYSFKNSKNGEDVFSGKKIQPFYARMGNPTTEKLENILSEIDGGIGAIATSTGMGASALAILSLCKMNDEIISIGGLFSGSYTLLNEFLPRFGIKTHFLSIENENKLENYINDKTKIIFCESIGNPNLKIPDFSFISKVANKTNIAFMVDNTLTPLSLQPISLGADIVIYSTTKIITGNASALGGVAIFKKVTKNDKFHTKKYNFLDKFIDKDKEKALVVNAKKTILRDLGMSANAFASYLGILGLETMPLRIEKINQNVVKLSKKLQQKEINVSHPSLKDNSQNNKYNTYFKDGCGCLMTIDLGNKEKAFKFLDNLKHTIITPNIGDTRTLGLHVSSTIYGDINEKTKKFLGVSDGLVRISLGLENVEIIIEDFLNSYNNL